MTKPGPQVLVMLPPRLLTAELAAAYTGRSRNTFLRGVADGEWPNPIRENRDLKLWDRSELDDWIERRKGNGSIISDKQALDRELGL